MRPLLTILFLAVFTIIRPAAHGHTFETLFAAQLGKNPRDGLVRGSDGNFYGTTEFGGAKDCGTIFKITPNGELASLAYFNGTNGSRPYARLVEGKDGNFYGTTWYGGAYQCGTVFKMTPDGALTTLASFNGLADQASALVQGRDGNFYGTTAGATGGTVFKITPTGEITHLVYFNWDNGYIPSGELTMGRDGNFYGATRAGGVGSNGTLFRVTPAGELTTLVSFNPTNGDRPSAGLVEGNDGNFYGTTESGGAYDKGTVFKMTPDGGLTTLVSFDSKNGSHPNGLVDGADGNLYGTTESGEVGSSSVSGTVFKITPAGEFTTLARFGSTNGFGPRGRLVIGNDGSFYGATRGGGASGYGTIFKVTSAGELTTVASFNLITGSEPRAGLVEGKDGNFYGTTELGGTSGNGSIFKVTPAGERTTLVSFNSTNGSRPVAELVIGRDGNFYGTTKNGGTGGNGTVFKMTPDGVLTTLVSFSFSYTNGFAPSGGLLEGSDGNFYGTTTLGGANSLGTIFKVTPAGVLTTLVSFNTVNGSKPSVGLVLGRDGNFYGTTGEGGASGYGTVFKMTPAGELSTLFSFKWTDGSPSLGRLVLGTDGNFYGTTSGGSSNSGTVFKVTPGGDFTALVAFDYFTNGSNPIGALVEGNDGNFYGTTSRGVASGCGTIFKVTPAGALTTLHSFDGTFAAVPEGTPIFGSDGKLYGTAGQMAIWRLWLATAPAATTAPLTGVTSTAATLSGTVNANGADAAVCFEYGLTPAYGSRIVATPGTVTGRSETAVSATLSGLSPHTTYYYRLTASNSEGATSTTGGSFTTANSRPIATSDSFALAPNGFGPISLAVLGNDTDADGDQLIITAVTQASVGTVTTDGATLTYTPGLGFVGRDSFSYTVSDGIDAVTAQVELRPSAPATRVLFSKGSKVLGTGQIGGIPAGALFKSFGTPSISPAGKLTFVASYGAQGGAGEFSVFVLDPQVVTSTLAARQGQAAPGTNGALFSSFKDPMLNKAGDVAFLATLSGGDVSKQNREGIWICLSSASSGAGTQLVARSGAQPPGAPDGARWRTFTSAALAGAGADTTTGEGGWSLAFTALMAPGAGGIKTSNDMGLWIASPEKTVLALREGQTLQVGGTEKTLRTFAALMSLPNTPGQGNGVTSAGAVTVQAFFTDGSQALLQVSSGANGDVTIEALGLAGDPVAGIDETAAKFGIPVQNSSGTATAWLGSLSGKSNPVAIFERNLSEPELLKLLARKGDAAPGIEGASFSAFRSVAVNDTGDALFLGKVSEKGISSSSDEGLWWKKGSGDSASLQLLAREGAQPPGVPEGARWSSFTSLALSEGPYGPLFTAKLVAGAKGKGPGKITSANDQGLWAVDSNGELQLVVQEGQEVIVEGSSTPKTLKSFTILSAVPGSPTQRRSFADNGQIVYRALFTDGSQAIVKLQLP